MSDEKAPKAEWFATPEDIIAAHRIVEEELGEDIEVNYMGLPKNVGVMGDGRVYGNSVVISTPNRARFNEIYAKHEALDKVMQRICGETGAACRVFLDITPDAGYFEVQHEI